MEKPQDSAPKPSLPKEKATTVVSGNKFAHKESGYTEPKKGMK